MGLSKVEGEQIAMIAMRVLKMASNENDGVREGGQDE